MWQPTNLEKERLEKVERLKALNVQLYPARVERSHSLQEAIDAFTAQDGKETPEDIQVTVTGRIRRLNLKGKVAFMHIEDESARLQLFLRINDIGEDVYNLVKEKLVETDDFVQASGSMMRTQAGEVSVHVHQFKLLSKSLSPLPVIKQQTQDDGTVVEYGEFTDKETRYRQRYADLAVNHDVRMVFLKRSKVLRFMREFLDNEGMLEVETPILQPIYGGAAARPFTTHHNELDQQLFLRVSFELYLKRLIVGGFDAVYEIGRDFRNEGVSFKHNPEFTMMEFYKAYTDYHGVADIVERMTKYICEQVNGTLTIPYKEHTVTLSGTWRRITMRDAIKEKTGIDYMDYQTADALRAVILQKYNQKFKPDETWGKMVEHLFGEFVEKTLINPTFIMDYPRDISPFAKRVSYDDFHVERWEVYMGGMELGNAFTELNDPIDQQERFEDMARLYKKEDDDATPMDEDYLRSMRYGMPPCGGFGMGIDRLVILLTNQDSIRDVLLFPHLKDEK
jgi:lysyl-tRNA synthetase, class II